MPADDTPPPSGDAARDAILDAVRAAVREAMGKPVELSVDHLNVLGDRAFVQATMHGMDGEPLDYADTPFREVAAHGGQSDVYMGLLKHDGGTWVLEASRIGPTDLAWVAWSDRFDVPGALFPSF